MRSRVAITVAIALLAGLLVPLLLGHLLPEPALVGTATVIVSTVTVVQGTLELPKETENVLRTLAASAEQLRLESLAKELAAASSPLPVLAVVTMATAPASTVTALREVAVPFAARETGTRYSLTNVQVAGVDEHDLVKTNGKVLAVVGRDGIYLVDAKEKRVLSRVMLKDVSVEGLFLFEDRLVVLATRHEARVAVAPSGPEGTATPLPVYTPDTLTAVHVFDVSNPSAPKLVESVEISGVLLGSRLIDGFVYVVTVQPALVVNERGSFEATLPIVVRNGKPEVIAPRYVLDRIGDSFVNVLALDLKELRHVVESVLMPPGSRMYMSLNRLYIVSQDGPSTIDAMKAVVEASLALVPENVAKTLRELLSKGDVVQAYEELCRYLNEIEDLPAVLEKIQQLLNEVVFHDLTHVFVFDVRGLGIGFAGNFTVSGSVLDQFAIEEYEGSYLVLATTRSVYWVQLVRTLRPEPIVTEATQVVAVTCKGEACKPVTVEVVGSQVAPSLRRELVPAQAIVIARNHVDNVVTVVDLRDMRPVGMLDGLAPGERVYAARLIKSILFLVTFREVDPLFAIDLTEPTKPVVLGYLKIPGFSEYLHPLPDDMLLGVGIENGSLKISLFNVSDPVRMSEVSKVLLEGAYSHVLHDHRAFTMDPDYGQVYIPIMLGSSSSGIAVVLYERGGLELKAILRHDGAVRSVYVGDELFTISPELVRAFDIRTLQQVADIPLR